MDQFILYNIEDDKIRQNLKQIDCLFESIVSTIAVREMNNDNNMIIVVESINDLIYFCNKLKNILEKRK